MTASYGTAKYDRQRWCAKCGEPRDISLTRCDVPSCRQRLREKPRKSRVGKENRIE